MSAWDKEHPNERRAIKRKHYLAHREELRAAARRYYAKNLERERARYQGWKKRCPEKVRRAALLRKHDMTLDEYQALLNSQGGVCAICAIASPGKPLSVDHDHLTGKVRGLLCSNCNLGIGKFGDDPTLIESAARYIGGNDELSAL